MSDLPPDDDFEDEEDEEPGRRQPANRDQDLLGNRPARGAKPKGGIRARLEKLYDDISEGFRDQADRADDTADFWDCYNCEPNQNKYYNGIAQIYFPVIHGAVNAIVTRQVNQLFPDGGRYVQVTGDEGVGVPSLVALLDHYIDRAGMATQVVAPLILNGQVEGQYCLYYDWMEVSRQLVSRETSMPRDPVTGVELPGGEPIDDIVEEDIIEGMPVYEVLHDSDVLVLPPTADTVEEALNCGGSVTILRRWSRAKIDAMAAAGNIRKDAAKELCDELERGRDERRDTERQLLQHLGINYDKGEARVWETWVTLPLNEGGKFAEDGRKRICRVFFGPQRLQLGAKRNPYWNDRVPLSSMPVEKLAGVHKGPSPIRYVESLQYETNDAANQGADAATLSAFPIVARDPEASDGPLVYNVGAVWDIANPTQNLMQLTFPDLTPRAATRIGLSSQAIMQSLNVNPSMLPQQVRDSQPTQAQVAQDQAVDLLTTAVGTKALERVLTEAVAWTIDLDYQFRDREIVVRAYGEEGKRANMEAIPPLQNRNGFNFVWRGGQQVRQNAMFAQQGAQMLNVMQNPALQQALAAVGLKFNPGRIMEQMIGNAFGPEVAQRSLIDMRDQLAGDPEEEDEWMLAGMEAMVHPLDDDQRHIQQHSRTIMERGDPTGLIGVHRQQHVMQAQAKMQAQMMQQLQQQMGGVPGAPPGQPQIGGPPGGPPGGQRPTPPGAMPAQGRPGGRQNGAIHDDQMAMAGGIMMPRRM